MVGLVVVYYFNKKVNGHSKRITTQESINHTQEISIAVMGKDIKTIKDNQEQQMKMLNNINNHLMK